MSCHLPWVPLRDHCNFRSRPELPFWHPGWRISYTRPAPQSTGVLKLVFQNSFILSISELYNGAKSYGSSSAFAQRKDFRMTSHTRAMRTLTLWSFAAAMMWFAGTALAQDLHGEALVKALQKGGYVLVMRHASSPREVPDKQAANPDNSKPERQLDEVGRGTAIAMGKALRDLKIPIGNVLSSPTYRALETVRLA